MSKIDSTGYVLTSLDDTIAKLVAALQGIFGEDINVDPNSYDGQTISIISESLNNLDQLGQAVFNSFNPSTASGNALSTLVLLNYLRRQAGAYSTVGVQVTASQGTVIPAGFVCESADGSKAQWISISGDVTVDVSGLATIQCQAPAFGPVAAAIGAVTKPVTGVYGLASITNLDPAVIGRSEETDEELRIRRANSTGANGGGTIDSIRGAIRNIIGVIQAEVYENNTDTVNANGQAAHSIYAVVSGGADQDIWNALWFRKPAGIDTEGTQVGTVVDTAGWPQTLKFDRPTATPIYIIANVKQRIGFPADGAARIKQALVDWANVNQFIGAQVIQSELYAPLMESINNTGSILSLYIGTTAGPTTTVDIDILYNAIASLDVSRITVNLS